MFNNANKQPIHIANSRGFFSVAVYLLSHAFDVKMLLRLDLSNRDYLQLLCAALKSANAEGECLRTTQSLLKIGCISCALDADGEMPLRIAVGRGFTSIINYLLSQDLPFPSDILLFALESRPLNILYQRDPYKWKLTISSLVRNGADVHARDSKQDTLLHYVMRLKSKDHCLEATKIFIEAGCSASVRNDKGELPILFAAALRRSSVVEYLLSRNAQFPPDILLTMFRGTSKWPGNLLRMVSLFVEHGADISAMSADGDTVLHVALVWLAHWDDQVSAGVVDFLVRAGCNTHARDANGRTPLELAKDKGWNNVAEYLQRCSSVSS